MSNPSYIANNIEELIAAAPEETKQLIVGDAVNSATATLGKIYKIPVSSFVALENIIVFILIGALKPEDVLRAIKDLLGLSDEDSYLLARDMEKSILEKARVKILGKPETDMVTLTFPEGRSPEDLRKELLDTTKRTPDPVPEHPKKPVAKSVVTPGSRPQLLEQLQVLDTIPKDEEIAERLKKIQEQIAGMKENESRDLESPVALQEFMPQNEVAPIPTPQEEQPATYSRAPTHYNVDPYREVAE